MSSDALTRNSGRSIDGCGLLNTKYTAPMPRIKTTSIPPKIFLIICCLVLYCTIVNPTGDCIDLRLREAPLVGHRSVSGKLFYIGCVLLNVLEYTKVRELIPVMAVVYSARAGNNGLDFILEADAGHDANALGGFTVRRIANGYHIFAGTQVGERRLILERSSIDTVRVRRFAADGRNGD